MTSALLGGVCRQSTLEDGYTELVANSGSACWVNGQKQYINQTGWKGEYCVGTQESGTEGTIGFIQGDQKVLTCKAGWEPKDLDDKSTTCIVPTPEQKFQCEAYGTIENTTTNRIDWNPRNHKCNWTTVSFGVASTNGTIIANKLIDYRDALTVCNQEGFLFNGKPVKGTFVVNQGLCYRGLKSAYKTPELCKEAEATWSSTTSLKVTPTPVISDTDPSASPTAGVASKTDEEYASCQLVLTSNPSTCNYNYVSNGQADATMVPANLSTISGKTYSKNTDHAPASGSEWDWSPSYLVEGTCELKIENARKIVAKKKK